MARRATVEATIPLLTVFVLSAVGCLSVSDRRASRFARDYYSPRICAYDRDGNPVPELDIDDGFVFFQAVGDAGSHGGRGHWIERKNGQRKKLNGAPEPVQKQWLKRYPLQQLREEQERLAQRVREAHVVWQAWIVNQAAAALHMESSCGIKSGPIWNRRPLDDILREQRENFGILTSKTTLSEREHKGLSEWTKYQKKAASKLARGVKSFRGGRAEIDDPAALLDLQEKDIKTFVAETRYLESKLARIKSEIARRAPNPRMEADAATPSEGDASENE